MEFFTIVFPLFGDPEASFGVWAPVTRLGGRFLSA